MTMANRKTERARRALDAAREVARQTQSEYEQNLSKLQQDERYSSEYKAAQIAQLREQHRREHRDYVQLAKKRASEYEQVVKAERSAASAEANAAIDWQRLNAQRESFRGQIAAKREPEEMENLYRAVVAKSDLTERRAFYDAALQVAVEKFGKSPRQEDRLWANRFEREIQHSMETDKPQALLELESEESQLERVIHETDAEIISLGERIQRAGLWQAHLYGDIVGEAPVGEVVFKSKAEPLMIQNE